MDEIRSGDRKNSEETSRNARYSHNKLATPPGSWHGDLQTSCRCSKGSVFRPPHEPAKGHSAPAVGGDDQQADRIRTRYQRRNRENPHCQRRSADECPQPPARRRAVRAFRVKWPRFAGQVGGRFKVYPSRFSCRQFSILICLNPANLICLKRRPLSGSWGRAVQVGRRQSIPSQDMASCAAAPPPKPLDRWPPLLPKKPTSDPQTKTAAAHRPSKSCEPSKSPEKEA